jgi:hypothetical protein
MHQTRKNCRRIVETFCRRARRGTIVEELWKNCKKILRSGVRRRRRGRIVEYFYNSSTILPQFFLAERAPAKSFYNFSTILPHQSSARKIFLQFFPGCRIPCRSSLYPSKETKFLRQFCGKIVEEFSACQVWGRIFLSAAD